MQYFSKIKSIRETDQGTDLIVRIEGEKIANKIAKFNKGTGGIDAELKINDGRGISIDQRKKIYATIRDISAFTGHNPEYLKEYLKYDYVAEQGEDYFSLSSCTMTTAKNFINHILEFILKWNIPLSDKGLNRTDDIDKYLFTCIKYRVCCISGSKNADIHHVEGSRVGMGRNRKKINHNQVELISLSREWHNRVHQEGEDRVFKLYKIYGITLDKETLKNLGLKYEDID